MLSIATQTDDDLIAQHGRRHIMKILNQHTLLCPVSDMDGAVAFYSDTLGLTTGYTSPHFSEIMMGETRIGLHPPFGDAALPTDGKGWVIGVQTDDIRALRKVLVDAGVHVADAYHDTPSGAVMDFCDPDGNPLQAIQVGVKSSDLDDNPAVTRQ